MLAGITQHTGHLVSSVGYTDWEAGADNLCVAAHQITDAPQAGSGSRG
ncbi:hypothetical protein [Streptomyces sp. NPDC054797]